MAVSIQFLEFQQIQFDLFKSQDPEIGKFDIVFEVEGKKLYGYRSMLPLISSTLNSMLSERWNKKKDEPVPIFGYSYDDFYQFLTFIYSGQCELTDKNINALVDIAEYYQVGLFKTYCDEFLSKMDLTFENVFQLLDLAIKYSLIKLKTCMKTFMVEHFVDLENSDNFIKAKKAIVTEIILLVKEKVRPEDLFQVIYKWAENQALNKQTLDQNGNLNDAIRNEMSCYLHYIDFDMMDLKFLNEFVVPRSFIFSSSDEFIQILDIVKSKPKHKVIITNNRGQKIHGNLIHHDETVIESIKSANKIPSIGSDAMGFVSWDTKSKIPTIPSPVKKRSCIEWYLVHGIKGEICLSKNSELREDDYLLAEMYTETEFEITYACEIEVLS